MSKDLQQSFNKDSDLVNVTTMRQDLESAAPPTGGKPVSKVKEIKVAPVVASPVPKFIKEEPIQAKPISNPQPLSVPKTDKKFSKEEESFIVEEVVQSPKFPVKKETPVSKAETENNIFPDLNKKPEPVVAPKPKIDLEIDLPPMAPEEPIIRAEEPKPEKASALKELESLVAEPKSEPVKPPEQPKPQPKPEPKPEPVKPPEQPKPQPKPEPKPEPVKPKTPVDLAKEAKIALEQEKKIFLQEAQSKLLKIKDEKNSLLSQKSNLEKDLDNVKNNQLQPILKEEAQIESDLEFARQKEKEAATLKDEEKVISDRKALEAKRKEAEKKRWETEDKITKLNEEIRNRDIDISKFDDKEAQIQKEKSDFDLRIEKAEQIIQRTQLEIDLKEIEGTQTDRVNEYALLLPEKDTVSKTLRENLIKKTELDQKINEIESREYQAQGQDKRAVEKERQEIEQKREDIADFVLAQRKEKERLEAKVEDLSNQIHKLDSQEKEKKEKLSQINDLLNNKYKNI